MDREQFRSELGRRIKSAREHSKLSLAQVAEQIGTSRAAIHDYEMGKKEPSAWVLSRLAPVLGYTIDDLVKNNS